MSSSFFQPYVGSNYHIGIKGKKILILGASFYCPKTACSFFSRCTNTTIKDSSPYDRICPEYSANGICLHDEPTNSIENWYPTYQTFAKGLEQFVGDADYNNIWSHLAFTNYVQFFLPSNGENFRATNTSDLSERDFDAFIEVVKELSPDIVIVWGCVINSSVKEKNQYVYDKEPKEVMGNLNRQSWDELWNSPEAEAVRRKVRCCDRDCWMIGSVSPAMHKYIYRVLPWVMWHKL